MAEKTIETKVADTVLEKHITVQVGDKSYFVAPPSTATIIMLSEAVSHLPHIALNPSKVREECMYVGKDCRVLGEIAAILILGAKNCVVGQKRVLVSGKRYLCRIFDTRCMKFYTETRKKNWQRRFLKRAATERKQREEETAKKLAQIKEGEPRCFASLQEGEARSREGRY